MPVSRWQRWWLDAWPHRLHIRRFVPRFLRACPDPFRGEVLEVGSGSGWTSRRILEAFPQVELTATDVDPGVSHAFERLQGKYGQRLKWRQADLLKLPFDRSSFDIVIGIRVLDSVDDVNGAVRQLLRVLRPGGVVGLSGEGAAWLTLERMLNDEGCEVVCSRGGGHRYLWARKPYA